MFLEAKDPVSRRDSVITTVHQLSSPVVHPQDPVDSPEPKNLSAPDATIQDSSPPCTNGQGSPLYSELSADSILQLQKKLTDIREGLDGA